MTSLVLMDEAGGGSCSHISAAHTFAKFVFVIGRDLVLVDAYPSVISSFVGFSQLIKAFRNIFHISCSLQMARCFFFLINIIIIFFIPFSNVMALIFCIFMYDKQTQTHSKVRTIRFMPSFSSFTNELKTFKVLKQNNTKKGEFGVA